MNIAKVTTVAYQIKCGVSMYMQNVTEQNNAVAWESARSDATITSVSFNNN